MHKHTHTCTFSPQALTTLKDKGKGRLDMQSLEVKEPRNFTKEPYMWRKEPYIWSIWKEWGKVRLDMQYLEVNDFYVFQKKEPHLCRKEPYIGST